MRKGQIFPVLLMAVCASVFALVSVARAHVGPTGMATHAVDDEGNPRDCVTKCEDSGESFFFDGPPEHQAPYTPSGATHERGGGTHSTSFQGLCTQWWCSEAICNPECECVGQFIDAKHLGCGGNFAVQEVDRALKDGSVPRLVAAVRDWDNVEYVEARRAIQVLNCDGEVVAHFPLTRDFAVMLSE